jgi:hypothetical protein
MSTAVAYEPRIASVSVTEDEIKASLVDGRTISVPLVWSWRLAAATREQRQNFEIIGSGQGVHWPDVDEDISAMGMLTGGRHGLRSCRRRNRSL